MVPNKIITEWRYKLYIEYKSYALWWFVRHLPCGVNSLWPNEAIGCRNTGSPLPRQRLCVRSMPIHNQTKWWLIANWPPGNKLWIKTKYCSLNALENFVCKMAAILCRPQYVHKVNIVENSKVEQGLFYMISFQNSSWGRVTHICVANPIIIGSDNGLSPGRRQAIV